MTEYPKIQTLFKRTDKGVIISGEYATPEFEYLADALWEWTEKIDGTNIRVMWDGETVRFGGRTDNASIPAHLFTRLTELFPPEKVSEVFGSDMVCLYGEGFGHKIQKGGAYLGDKVDFALFDVKIGQWWLRQYDIGGIAGSLGIACAPILNVGPIGDAAELVKAGIQSCWGTAQAEGLVGRPVVQLFDRMGHRIITKLKTKDFKRLAQAQNGE